MEIDFWPEAGAERSANEAATVNATTTKGTRNITNDALMACPPVKSVPVPISSHPFPLIANTCENQSPQLLIPRLAMIPFSVKYRSFSHVSWEENRLSGYGASTALKIGIEAGASRHLKSHKIMLQNFYEGLVMSQSRRVIKCLMC